MATGLAKRVGLCSMLLMAGLANRAAAQTSTPVAPVPRLELGSGISVGVEGGFFVDTAARANLARAFGIGVTVAWAGSQGGYVLDGRWAPRGFSGPVQPFMTGGTLGEFTFRSSPGTQRTITTTGDTLVYAPFRDLEISAPKSVVAGAGVRLPVQKHMALEAVGQVWVGRFRPSPAFVGSIRMTVAFGQVGR